MQSTVEFAVIFTADSIDFLPKFLIPKLVFHDDKRWLFFCEFVLLQTKLKKIERTQGIQFEDIDLVKIKICA